MTQNNPQYKDRLFNFIFGSEENKKWTLSLFNAINGTNYSDESAITINTIKEIMYLSMHNDVSFLISLDCNLLRIELNLYEQQSSFNPNLPLRFLQYLGNLYERYVVENKLNKYGSKLIKLPAPKLVVFYNGKKEQKDEEILRLSDAFPEGADADVEVKVRMININYGRSSKILEACKPLKEYSWLVDRIRNSEGEIEHVIDKAITDVPNDFEIKPFLMAHRAEVKGMLLTEYNEAETMELFREEGREEGRKEGREEGMIEGAITTLINMVKKGRLSKEVAAEEANMTINEFSALMMKA